MSYGDPCAEPIPVEGGHTIFIQVDPPGAPEIGDLWWDGAAWNEWSGVVWAPQVVQAEAVEVAFTPASYTPTDATLTAHLEAIDAALTDILAALP